jgi:DNA recombination protein RmuC
MSILLVIALLASSGFGLLFSIFTLLRSRRTHEMVFGIAQDIMTFEGVLKNSLSKDFEQQQKYLTIYCDSRLQQLNIFTAAQKNQLDTLYGQLGQISNMSENKLDNIRRTLYETLSKLQEDNNKKLEDIRITVDEKLQSTLERRLSESFKLVGERLEMVYKGLGEMQSLASGVGDLKKVLTNVKTRGIWGEAQLSSILQHIMSPEQYSSNVAVSANHQDRVEYAIKLPGKEDGSFIWLPIDAKFPLEDYHKLIDAHELGDVSAVEKSSKDLEINLKKCAKTISQKYINPPTTTEFAIMFLPVEGLYAEALRKPGLIEALQQEYRIVITGPTTVAAILNSLQMGFKTMAIEKHSSQVWKVLESIKPEFNKFADLLSKTRIKLEQASQSISDAEKRTKTIQQKLARAATSSIDSKDDTYLIE